MIKSICIISDTHNLHEQIGPLPDADVLVHCGDVTMGGTEGEVIKFLKWFFIQPHKYKVFIGGNHDFCLYGAEINALPDNCYYLNGNGVVIDKLKFYGVPMFMEDAMSGDYDKMIATIPGDTDVLITHQAPYSILSSNIGDMGLLKKVKQIQPIYHFFGHTHDKYGIEKHGKTTFVNSALVNIHYEMKYKPILIHLK